MNIRFYNKDLSTTELSDALESFGYTNGLRGIKAYKQEFKIFGPAFTVARNINEDKTYFQAADFIEQVPEESVIIIDNLGITDSTCWGEILTICALNKNIRGTVINGVYRDASVVDALNYPIFSKGSFMVTGKGKTRLVGVNIPITIEGVKILPGDLVVGDNNGVVIIPQDIFKEVMERANSIYEVEKKIKNLVNRGMSLEKARKIMNYNQLSMTQPS
ncbi:hypothetical protein VF14_24000 [Nostoc linckia z18]|uniref:Putative 4-hydroxy-4-methyl-2-oxoglutarate aldolase n=2 Tax=Nostoc linckia TaxID=92942 RepID=A0A9Q5Z9D7_NOSLI|nr:RraA family protein [Nostoc linckia]PHK39980.1 hypothetical protein VF12_12270 [Nostoc linckia z15]PHK44000.1 hypothetical protein VF13_24115 [Nostoc linckia z16]PHJ56856.1 hypothetical protein VF02_31715 [Nostoc linckia z1]PHJ58746.1 hypothetical protein VF05_33305 [Nostoc linckia z3]PHJ62554.1 hypothetical protein VF03_31205 [Nostoc linckia z2]